MRKKNMSASFVEETRIAYHTNCTSSNAQNVPACNRAWIHYAKQLSTNSIVSARSHRSNSRDICNGNLRPRRHRERERNGEWNTNEYVVYEEWYRHIVHVRSMHSWESISTILYFVVSMWYIFGCIDFLWAHTYLWRWLPPTPPTKKRKMQSTLKYICIIRSDETESDEWRAFDTTK